MSCRCAMGSVERKIVVSLRDYVHAHPRYPALIVEVAHSSLLMARGRKARGYARARITD